MELLIRTKGSSNPKRYQDGDIVAAFSAYRILWARAQVRTKPDGFTSDGLRATSSLCFYFHKATAAWMFERIANRIVQRTDLEANATDLVSSTPNAAGEYMHVAEHLKIKTAHPKHLIFGQPGREVWFGGRRDNLDLHSLWADVIETHSPHRHDDNLTWPFTEREKRTCLCIACKHPPEHVDDHDHDEACECGYCDNELGGQLVRSEMDGDIVTKKRVCSVPYWELAAELGTTVETIRNRELNSDVRKNPGEGRPLLAACVVGGYDA